MVDNNAAVHIINKMGTSHSSQCKSLCFKIWNFCIENEIWLIAAHLPGSKNILADKESRTLLIYTEWMLNPFTLQKALKCLDFIPEIDLFASRLNKQFPQSFLQ